MNEPDLSRLRAFATLAETLNFRRAAACLKVSPSALTHSIRSLEDQLGARLFNRTTRSVSLSDSGHRLFERIGPALGSIHDALLEIGGEREQPSGCLRIYATNLAAATVIAPIWKQYRDLCPDVNLEVTVGEASIDFVAAGFDAAIWSSHRLPAQDLIRAKVSNPIRVAVVGAPAYFCGRSRPQTPDDLRQHECVRYSRGSDPAPVPWHFVKKNKWKKINVQGKAAINDHIINVQCALTGLGIAYTFEPYVARMIADGSLVRILEDWSPIMESLFLYYSSHRLVPASLRGFIDLISEQRQTNLFAEEVPAFGSMGVL